MNYNVIYDTIRISELIKEFLKNKSGEMPEELKKWIEESAEHKQLFEKTLNWNLLMKKIEQQQELDMGVEWISLRKKLSKRFSKYSFNRIQIVLAASLSAAIFVISLMVFNPHQPQKAEIPFDGNAILPGKVMATLVTSNKKIDLDSTMVIEVLKGTVVLDKLGKRLYDSEEIGTTKENKLITPRGGEYFIKLEDGTKIWLNSESELIYPEHFNSRFREIKISGEAYIEVAKNPFQPMYVVANNIKVKVLGTAFNISNYKNDTESSIALLEGSVQIESMNGTTLAQLTPNEQIVISNETGEMNVSEFDLQSVMAWRNNQFVFKNELLSSIIRKLERWYNIDISAEESLLKNRYSGMLYRHNTLEPIINILSKTNEMRFFEIYPGKVEIISCKK